jgi:transcriptional regulator with PAS, ATPase and Fis domain
MSGDRFHNASGEASAQDAATLSTGETVSDAPERSDLEVQSPAMRELLAKAARVASSKSTILITGETGVGKERLARWLHAHSGRAAGGFVAVNCATFPDTLLDTHLFGHARGAFTGAIQESPGIFEAATGGTLFLDEIGEVSPAVQAKLLRVLQEREVRRVGEWRLRPVDVRLIAATNRHLEDEVQRGRFREDLFYRVRVVRLHIPPLRERRGDLPSLARELLAHMAAREQRPITGYAPQALACLLRYDWPGNVREFENAIEEACASATGSEIQLEDLPDTIRPGSLPHELPAVGPAREGRRLADLERAHIDMVLEQHRGHRRRAAEELGISLSTLKRRLRRHRRAL